MTYTRKNIFEHRVFLRLDSHIQVQYKKIAEYNDVLQGTLAMDIGGGGLKFVVNDFIPLSTKLKVEMFLPPSADSISALCKVVWIEGLPHSDRYHVGVQFMDLSDEDRKHIAGYILLKNAPGPSDESKPH